ncbi:elongation factor Ts [bacterium BMS3Bbin12]|nr:elongation factor Ts [bacterium BMS3Abin12]GBE48403.1 elongation factor Ts [bacterium BMS3Bbin12]GBE50548.1 elongation factor Ts [bacterium BMS3Bbin13]HDK02678.1 elongation factor Ts [Gammaproteobacteria bacterium]
MQISASLVKELRDRTGAGMMECKKALTETDGDLDVAVEHMRKAGLAKAGRKAGRVAAEGVIVLSVAEDARRAAMVEVNCETDFVAKGEDFHAFCETVARRVLDSEVEDLDALLEGPIGPQGGVSVDTARRELIAKLGENIAVRRFERYAPAAGARLGAYLHGTRIGVLIEMRGGDDVLARDVAMHIAASRPACVDEAGVSPALIEQERGILRAQAEQSGKPPEIIEKMVEGRLRKFFSEVTLLGQPFVKDLDQSVGKLLKGKGVSVTRFCRFEVGEGIEKKTENFAEEVMSQVRGS